MITTNIKLKFIVCRSSKKITKTIKETKNYKQKKNYYIIKNIISDGK